MTQNIKFTFYTPIAWRPLFCENSENFDLFSKFFKFVFIFPFIYKILIIYFFFYLFKNWNLLYRSLPRNLRFEIGLKILKFCVNYLRAYKFIWFIRLTRRLRFWMNTATILTKWVYFILYLLKKNSPILFELKINVNYLNYINLVTFKYFILLLKFIKYKLLYCF